MKQKSLLKPRSHRFWNYYNLSKHVPIAFASFCDGNMFWHIDNAGNTAQKAFENMVSLQKLHKKAPE